jgi:hypothetical protein
MKLNSYFYCPLGHLAAMAVKIVQFRRPVPQVILNRLVKLATTAKAAQPNYALDRLCVERIPKPVQNGNADRLEVLEKGKRSRPSEWKDGARPAGRTPFSENR